MKILFLIRILGAFFLSSCALHAQAPARESAENNAWWAGAGKYTLTLSAELTLKDIFDSGIRPRHVQAMGGERLSFRAEKMTIVYPNGKRVSSKPGYGRLSLSVDQRVSSITFYESMMTGLDEGKQRLIEYGKVFTNENIDTEIEKQVQVVRAQPDHFVVTPTSVGKRKINKYWKGSVTAHRSHDEQLPFRFIISAGREWQGRRNDLKYDSGFSAKMLPPEGYEHISMEFVPSPAGYDGHRMFKAQLKALATASEKELDHVTRSEEPVAINDPVKDNNVRIPHFPRIIITILIFVLLAGLLVWYYRGYVKRW